MPVRGTGAAAPYMSTNFICFIERGKSIMAKKMPNLLFFGIDSLRRNHMSHYGYGRLTTPNITKYAEGGVTFDN